MAVASYAQKGPGEPNTRFKDFNKLWTNDSITPYKITDAGLEYTVIADIPNRTKNEMYNAVLDYITKNYMNGKAVIQEKDRETGKIIAKGVFLQFQGSCPVEQTHIISIDFKDNRLRSTVTLANLHFNCSNIFSYDALVTMWYPLHAPMDNARQASWLERRIVNFTRNNLEFGKKTMDNIISAAKNAASDEW